MSSWYARNVSNTSSTRNKECFVTVVLSGGLENRIFQVLAAQHFAEKTGRKFYLHRNYIQENPHESFDTTIAHLVKLFPTLEFYGGLPVEWNIVKEEQYMMFQYQPDIFKKFPGQHIVLEGYFFNSKYFPKAMPSLGGEKRLPLFFLHICLGDVNLKNYYRDAILNIQTMQKDARFLVFSDEPEKAEIFLKSLALPVLKYSVSDAKDSLTVLKDMASCVGGICANSSLSWLGAFFQRPRGPILMPSLWMKGLLKNQATELFPSWVTVIDVRETRSSR